MENIGGGGGVWGEMESMDNEVLSFATEIITGSSQSSNGN